MENIKIALSGKKTYITAALAVVGVWFAYLTGYDFDGTDHVVTLTDAVRLSLEAAMAAFIRAGVAKA